MIPIPTTTRPTRRLRFEIRDILAVVVGYGMAAVFFRAFWPAGGPPTWVLAPATILYLWLGLALSGPVLLLRRRTPDQTVGEPGTALPPPTVGTHTWAEWAWLFVGGYWVVLGLFVIPARLHAFGAGDALLFGMVPILAGLVSRLIGARTPSATVQAESVWTHAAAVWLLLTWPVAWACLVAVGRGLR
jgi:hypothetical protein